MIIRKVLPAMIGLALLLGFVAVPAKAAKPKRAQNSMLKPCLEHIVLLTELLTTGSNYAGLWSGDIIAVVLKYTGSDVTAGVMIPPIDKQNIGKIVQALEDATQWVVPSEIAKSPRDLHHLLASWTRVSSQEGGPIALLYNDFDMCGDGDPPAGPPPALSSSQLSPKRVNINDLPWAEYSLPNGYDVYIYTLQGARLELPQNPLPAFLFLSILLLFTLMLLKRRPQQQLA